MARETAFSPSAFQKLIADMLRRRGAALTIPRQLSAAIFARLVRASLLGANNPSTANDASPRNGKLSPKLCQQTADFNKWVHNHNLIIVERWPCRRIAACGTFTPHRSLREVLNKSAGAEFSRSIKAVCYHGGTFEPKYIGGYGYRHVDAAASNDIVNTSAYSDCRCASLLILTSPAVHHRRGGRRKQAGTYHELRERAEVRSSSISPVGFGMEGSAHTFKNNFQFFPTKDGAMSCSANDIIVCHHELHREMVNVYICFG